MSDQNPSADPTFAATSETVPERAPRAPWISPRLSSFDIEETEVGPGGLGVFDGSSCLS